MGVISTSGAWSITVRNADGLASLDQVDFSEGPGIKQQVTGSINDALAAFDGVTQGQPYVASLTATVTLDEADDIDFYLFAAGHARLYVDDELVGEVTAADLPGAGPGPCPANGGAVCLCQADTTVARDKIETTIAEGTREIRIEYLNLDPSEAMDAKWSVGSGVPQTLDLTLPSASDALGADEIGQWGDVIDTGIMGIHQVLLGDGRVLYWGDNGDGNAFSGNQSYGIFDPKTGTHEVLSESYAVQMFCGAGVLIPGTDKILVSAGYSGGADDSRVFDLSEGGIINDPEYALSTGRFYPTMISLSTGQLVILGGNGGGGKATPEIFTLGEGWRTLDGATDADIGANWWYPDAWVNKKGEVLYIAVGAGNQNGGTNAAGTFEVMALDPEGDGSIRQVAEVPFQMDVRSSAAMYDVGKVVIMDHVGDLWIMDINGDTPTFTFAADLPGDRENGDMTVLADGRVLLNGGSRTGNSQSDANAVFVSEIFDPYTGTVTQVDAEDVLRVYHSSSILLPDGTVMSSGGGGLGGDRDFWDAQIYQPDYLFNEDGTLADRPVISAAPADIEPGESFVVTVDDAATISRMSFVKTGSITHSTNMESGRMDLDFTVLSPTQIELSLPENPNIVGAGNWMLFAIDTNGVPSEAPIISVMPTVPAHVAAPEAGKFVAQFFDVGTVSSLNDIDFAGAVVHTEEVDTIQYISGRGGFYEGGETDTFAARFVGKIDVAEAGSYTFYLTSDDGSALYVNGERVIGNDGLHAMREDTVTLDLDARPAKIEVRYFENRGYAGLDLDWSGPSFGRVALTGSGELPPPPPPPPAPEPGMFTAQYFDVGPVRNLSDIDFGGTVLHTEVIEDIQFTRTANGFYEGGPVDTFAGRFTGTIEVAEAGTYTFYLTSDDGSALYINGEEVLGNDGLHAMRLQTATVDLGAGPAEIEVRYFENRGSAGLDLDWSGPGFERVPLKGSGQVPPPPPTPPAADPGLFTAQYFEVGPLGSLGEINFAATPIYTEQVESMQYAASGGGFYAGGPTDTFAARFTGTIDVAEAGSYTFYLTSDDGSALYLDGKLVLGNDGLHAMRQQTVTLDLVAGAVDLDVRYFENFGSAGLDLDWAGPGFGRTALTAAENLITNGDFEDISAGTGPRSTPEAWDTTGPVSGVFNASAARGEGYAYALGGWSGAGGQTLCQTIDTVAGETYTLTFDAGGAYRSISGALDVLADGVEIASLSDADLGNSTQTRSYSFTATGEKTKIEFVFDGTGSGDIDIDNVSVVVATHERTSIDVAGGDLEGISLANGSWTAQLEGWQKTGNAGTWNPRVDHFDFEAFEGDNVGYINSGSVSQTLDAEYDPTLAYEVALHLGGRKSAAGSDYTVSLYAGDTAIAQTSGSLEGRGTWEAIKLQAGVGTFEDLAGETLRIDITDDGGPQLNFDAVTLSSIEIA